MIDDFLLDILMPRRGADFLTEDDLTRAEREKVALCDEANLQVFAVWYEFGGMKRPLTPVEAASMPADLAKDFAFLLRRMRQLADNEMQLGDWINRNIFRDTERHDALYTPKNPWE